MRSRPAAWLVLLWLLPAHAIAASGPAPVGKIRQRYLANPAFHWKCDTLTAEDLCYPARVSPAIIDSVAHDFDRILGQELEWAGASAYRPRVHVFLVESPGRMRELVGAYAYGSSEPSEHIACFVLGHPESLTHELNHEVMTHLWGHTEPWIAEGLAAFVSDPRGVDRDAALLLLQHHDVPLSRMVRPGWTASEYPSTVIYPELGSFVKYLRTTYGMDGLRQVWQKGSVAIRTTLGKPLTVLERDWRDSLLRH